MRGEDGERREGREGGKERARERERGEVIGKEELIRM